MLAAPDGSTFVAANATSWADIAAAAPVDWTAYKPPQKVRAVCLVLQFFDPARHRMCAGGMYSDRTFRVRISRALTLCGCISGGLLCAEARARHHCLCGELRPAGCVGSKSHSFGAVSDEPGSIEFSVSRCIVSNILMAS